MLALKKLWSIYPVLMQHLEQVQVVVSKIAEVYNYFLYLSIATGSGVSSDSKAKAKGFLKKLTSRKTILLGSFATDVIDIHTAHHITSPSISNLLPWAHYRNIASDCDKATSTNREVNANLTVDNFKIILVLHIALVNTLNQPSKMIHHCWESLYLGSMRVFK